MNIYRENILILVQIEHINNENPIITIIRTGEKLEFVQSHGMYLVRVKFQNQLHIIETEEPWVISNKGNLLIAKIC